MFLLSWFLLTIRHYMYRIYPIKFFLRFFDVLKQIATDSPWFFLGQRLPHIWTANPWRARCLVDDFGSSTFLRTYRHLRSSDMALERGESGVVSVDEVGGTPIDPHFRKPPYTYNYILYIIYICFILHTYYIYIYYTVYCITISYSISWFAPCTS